MNAAGCERLKARRKTHIYVVDKNKFTAAVNMTRSFF